MIRNLARDGGAAIGERIILEKPGLVLVSVLPKETAWYIESALLQGLKAQGLTVVSSEGARYLAEFGFINARVEYENVRRDGFFGSRIVDRIVSLKLSTKIVDNETGVILESEDFNKSLVDTIVLSSLSTVENPNLPITRGVMQQQGFFANFAEPLIVVGAIAVAVFLLFSVRS